MNNKIKISVLVSIYNHDVEYVRKCLESLKEQTFNDLEIILLDNGATKESKALIEEFLPLDNRFKVIHINENQGYGHALNLGLAEAKGDYIGIVESDDFTHPEMYEKLYKQITKFDADVCIAGFYVHNNGYNDANNIHTKQIFENSSDKNLFSITDYPFLFTCHQSIWAKLYKTEFIKSFGFSETGCYIDSQFICELYSRTNKLIALKDYVIYYRADNTNASNSNARRDKSLMNILDDWEESKLILKKHGLFNTLKEEFYYQASKAGYRFYKNIAKKYKYEFFNKWKKFVADLKDDQQFTFKYFDKERKEFFKNILNDNYIQTLCIETTPNSLLENIFSIKNTYSKRHKIITILGVKIKIKKKLKNKKNKIEDTITELYYLQKSNIQAAMLHKTTFSTFKNKHNLQDIILYGSGPSLKYYTQMPNKIHIGVNRTFLNSNLDLNYLFIQDYLKGENDMELANKYNPESCIKFYGILPEKRYEQVKCNLKRISNIDICAANARPYIIEDSVRKNWANLLEIEPIGDWCGSIFSAFQFALYTNPKRIYLVGCDCSNDGHFHKERAEVFNSSSLEYQKKSWIELKKHLDRYYHNLEIISVNPIGLKGMFKDVYTQSYVDEHPELLNENIEILDRNQEKELVNS